jgi:hypothetical protein
MLVKAGIIPADAAVQKIATDAGAKLPAPATRDLFQCTYEPPAAASITLPPNTPGPTGAPAPAGVTLNDFVAYLPEHTYIFLPNGKHWPKDSINAVIAPMPLLNQCGLQLCDEKGKPKTIAASLWLDQNQPVHDMTWAPGEPELIEDKITCEGGWTNAPGRTTFNLYKPPEIKPRAGDASPWVDHIRRIYPMDADHIINWLAHCVQRPGDKINHALVLGGEPGIGKDSILATHRCNEKHRKQYSVFNVCGAIMTI